MNIQLINPRKSLNKAFLKQKPLRSEIELFKTNLIRLLDKVDENERESLKQAASFAHLIFLTRAS